MRKKPRSATPSTGRSGVQTIDRAFGLLELLAASGGELTLTSLTERSGLPMPTIHRLLQTLVAAGYVYQGPSRRYALGPRLIWLGESAEQLMSSWVRPHLQNLVDTTEETTNMAMLDGDRAVYVAQVPSPRSMRMFTEVGRRVHLHCTGVGKALLSAMAPEQAAAVVARLPMPRMTEHTITEPARLLAEVESARELGFAVDDGEQEVGVRCVAAPVTGAPALMAISISGPSARMNDQVRKRTADLLIKTADSLSEELRQQMAS